MKYENPVSNCCGANMFNEMCMDCKEHCSPEEDECEHCGHTPDTGACFYCKMD